MTTASWLIRLKEIEQVLFATFHPKIPKTLNTKKYETVPLSQSLASLKHEHGPS